MSSFLTVLDSDKSNEKGNPPREKGPSKNGPTPQLRMLVTGCAFFHPSCSWLPVEFFACLCLSLVFTLSVSLLLLLLLLLLFFVIHLLISFLIVAVFVVVSSDEEHVESEILSLRYMLLSYGASTFHSPLVRTRCYSRTELQSKTQAGLQAAPVNRFVYDRECTLLMLLPGFSGFRFGRF